MSSEESVPNVDAKKKTRKRKRRNLSCYRSKRDKGMKSNEEYRKDFGVQMRRNKLQQEINNTKVLLVHASDSEEMVDVEGDISATSEVYDEVDDDGSTSWEDEEESEEVEDHVEQCVQELMKEDRIRILVNRLDRSRNLKDFMVFIRQLISGELHMSNIVFLLMLERAKWQQCKTTTNMRYRKTTKLFWSIVYRLCRGVGLKFFSGQKNWSQVLGKIVKKGCYPPNKANVNFAVPDERHLRSVNKCLPSVIQPGLIHQSINMLKDKKDIVLMADAKLITRGLGDNYAGDVNLFGYEGPPNIEEFDSQLNNDLNFIAKSLLKFPTLDNANKYELMRDLLLLITEKIKKVREYQVKEEKRLHMYLLQANDPKQRKPERGISAAKTNLYISTLWIKRALRLNLDMLYLLSRLQHNAHTFSVTKPCDLSKQQNVRQLHNIDYVSKHVDINSYPHLIKQGSEEWNDMRLQSMVTGSTAHRAIGLNTIKDMKQHFREYVLQEERQSFPDEVQQMLDYGKENEIHGFTTVATLLMPALLPSCAILYEEGCNFIQGKHHKRLVEVSPDGYIRHHHTTGQERFQCNEHIYSDHDNICLEVKSVYPGKFKIPVRYTMPRYNVIQILAEMKSKNCYKNWYITQGKDSVVLIESTFDEETWKTVFRSIRDIYDQQRPKLPNKVTEMRTQINAVLDNYIENYTHLVCEVPRMKGIQGKLVQLNKFCPFHIPEQYDRIYENVAMDDSFHAICDNALEIVEEGYNLLRNEATEILAFLATDCNRLIQPGIPHHLPIAYGLKGTSLKMDVMRKIVNDINAELDANNTTVLCEVYDGQFQKLIVRSQDGSPLTRIQQVKDHWNKLRKCTKQQLLNHLLTISAVSESELDTLQQLQRPEDNCELNLDNILTYFSFDTDQYKIAIGSKGQENYTLQDIVTVSRPDIWLQNLQKHGAIPQSAEYNDMLTTQDLDNLIQGTKLHRRQQMKMNVQTTSQDNSDSEEDDPDFDPEDDDMSESDDTDIELDHEETRNFANMSTTSVGDTCLNDIVRKFKQYKNKHNWQEATVDTLLSKYLSSKDAIRKLFVYELDVINECIFSHFGKKIFKKGDSKAVKVNKMSEQLKQLPQFFNNDDTDGTLEIHQPDSLFAIYKKFILSKYYPKDFLAAQVAKITHLQSTLDWEAKSTIPVRIQVPGINEPHIIFYYPERNESRRKEEIRTFDPTHILNNLRFHISTKGFTGISRQAFLEVSETHHDILPRTIVEDTLDRQNSRISIRFFSEDVEKVLIQNGRHNEAEFVHYTRLWYAACDERGLSLQSRIMYLWNMYEYMLRFSMLSEYPPCTTHISGIPIQTYEALMQSISVHFMLFHFSSNHSLSFRTIGTLPVESWFSDLTRFEFSSLGAPKSVDIAKLISHVVHLNTVKHDPNRGFEFITSVRNYYPYYLMENENFTVYTTQSGQYREHLFDKHVVKPRKRNQKWFKLAKPKQVAKGGHGVRQFLKIDETRMPLEKRAGLKRK